MDVAARAGVSLKTVSRALSGAPNVSPSMLERVTAAAQELGYRPNANARDLRSQAPSRTVGLIVGDLANPFYGLMMRQVERELRAAGYLLLVASSDNDADRERQLAGTLLESRVAGLIVVTSGERHDYLQRDVDRGLPVVFLDRVPGDLAAPSVVFDNVGGARRATEHLLAHGHRRLAMLGDTPGLPTTKERHHGFRLALNAAGAGAGTVRLGLGDQDEAERAAAEMLSGPEPPTAFFAANNRLTVGVLAALRATGSAAAVVGFDDFELADVLGVSVVSHEDGGMGEVGARLMLDQLAGRAVPGGVHVLGARLLPRGTGEVPPPMPEPA